MTDDYGSYVNGSCPPPDFSIDPEATEDFVFALGADLDGDTIASADFLLPDGLTEVSSSNTTTTATIFVSGAQLGRTYRITCRYTTAGGRTRDKTIYVIGRSH
jgi:hypothetical protein